MVEFYVTVNVLKDSLLNSFLPKDTFHFIARGQSINTSMKARLTRVTFMAMPSGMFLWMYSRNVSAVDPVMCLI